MAKYYKENPSSYRLTYQAADWGSPVPKTVDGTTDLYYSILVPASIHGLPIVSQVESHSTDGFEDYPIEIPYRIDHVTRDVLLYFRSSNTAPFRGYSDIS